MLFPNKKEKVTPYSKPGMSVYTKIIVPDITEVLLQYLPEYCKSISMKATYPITATVISLDEYSVLVFID